MRLRYGTGELIIKGFGSLVILGATSAGVWKAVNSAGDTIWERGGYAAAALALGVLILGTVWYLPIKRAQKK